MKVVRCSLLGFLVAVVPAQLAHSEPMKLRDPVAYGDIRGGPVRALEATQDESYWIELGYRRIFPAIELPTTNERSQITEIWIRLPEKGEIKTSFLAEQNRFTIEFPDGTRIDRIQRQYPEENDGGTRMIQDVRGTCLRESGEEFFHVLKPRYGFPSKSLLGFRWARDSREQRMEALNSLTRILNVSREAASRAGDADKVQCIDFFNDCENCHSYNKPEKPPLDGSAVPVRPTDASGFYVPLMVLKNSSPPSSARPVDLLAKNPFVSVTCNESDAELRSGGGHEYWACPDGGNPIATYSIERARRAGDAYARKVCDSRRFLYERLDERGKKAFAREMADCQ